MDFVLFLLIVIMVALVVAISYMYQQSNVSAMEMPEATWYALPKGEVFEVSDEGIKKL